jgi:hypothetical protein
MKNMWMGVSCTHCHVDFVSFDEDDKPAKGVARDMIRVVQALNTGTFGVETPSGEARSV